ncbi:MAG: hypothetical protein JST50_03985 [Bacteroidetes bacterium]|jgi:hypothetical protein|nr:hypothetical protein [Bacteroidota bacterium]
MELSSHIIGNQKYIFNANGLVKSLKDYLDLYLLQKVPNEGLTDRHSPDVIFKSNSDFWNSLLEVKNYPGKIVRLDSFSILEWLPASPGLFYTEQAFFERRHALERSQQYIGYQKSEPVGNKFVELQPNEKIGMIRGGFGSVRLNSKTINGSNKYFLCASSTKISHEGIPIVVEEIMYQKLMEVIASDQLPLVNIVGKLRLLPDDCSLLKIQYHSSFPKFYVEVIDYEIKAISKSDDAIVSITITYTPEKTFVSYTDMSYSFCTFSPSRNDQELKQSIQWLNDYAVRYSGSQEPLVLGDFDEFFDHYKNVRIPLKELMNGHLSSESLEALQKYFHFEINYNVFEKVYKSKIINNSNVNNSNI